MIQTHNYMSDYSLDLLYSYLNTAAFKIVNECNPPLQDMNMFTNTPILMLFVYLTFRKISKFCIFHYIPIIGI